MTLKHRKLIDISLALALIACVCLSMTGFAGSCEDMYENIIRIRIIANSDRTEDQNLKLQVRDEILKFSEGIFAGAESYEDAVRIADCNLEDLKNKAQSVVNDSGFDYSVDIRMGEEYFNTRVYGDFTLPAGTYETLVFTLGEGKGENWWCVMFPQVCVGACAGKLTDSVKESSAERAENPQKYVLEFKIVELFQKIKKIL